MLPAGIKAGDYLVSAKTGKRLLIREVSIINHQQVLLLYDKENGSEFETILDKINPEMYYVEVGNTQLQAIKSKKLPKVKMTPDEKQKGLDYLNQRTDIPEWLRQDLIKEVKR